MLNIKIIKNDPSFQNMRHIKENVCAQVPPSTERRHVEAMNPAPCHLQLHRNRCHSLSPPLTSSIGSSQQPLDNWSSSLRSPQRERGKTDTTQRTFNLYEPTETEAGEGGAARQRDGLWGTEILLMRWVVLANGGGVGLSDPFQHAQKKSRPKPLCWTRVAMVTPLPSGTRSAGNQLTECVCSVYEGIQKMLCHHYCLKQTGLTVTSTPVFPPFGSHINTRNGIHSLLFILQLFPHVLVYGLCICNCVYKGCHNIWARIKENSYIYHPNLGEQAKSESWRSRSEWRHQSAHIQV